MEDLEIIEKVKKKVREILKKRKNKVENVGTEERLYGKTKETKKIN